MAQKVPAGLLFDDCSRHGAPFIALLENREKPIPARRPDVFPDGGPGFRFASLTSHEAGCFFDIEKKRDEQHTRNIMQRLALSCFSIVLLALCIEGGLRLIPQAIPLDALREFEPGLRSEIAGRRGLARRVDMIAIPRGDGGPAERLYRYKPGAAVTMPFPEEGIVETVHMDAQGFCNAPADAYSASRFDVIAVGDSFTFCTSVEPADTWPAQLASRTGLSTYDLGLPGRGLHEYVETLRHFGLSKQPRVVVMNAYEGNDLRDAYFFRRELGDSDRRLGAASCPFDDDVDCERFLRWRHGILGRNSYSFSLVLGLVWAKAGDRKSDEVDFQYDVRFADGSVLGFNSRNGDRDEVLFARSLAAGRIDAALMDDALEAYSSMAREHGFLPVLTYTPSAYTAYEKLSIFQDPTIESDLRAYSRTLRDYFERRSSELGLVYLDATPALQAAAQQGGMAERLYFRTNVHFTKRGHAVLAGEVARLLDGLGVGSASER